MLRLFLLLALVTAWDGTKVVKSDAEWRSLLGRERYAVMRRKATEPPYSGSWRGEGTYRCAACGLALFASSAQYAASHGWPAFREPIVQRHVWIKEDCSLSFKRYEVLCRSCDSHLGHVFRRKTDGSLRYTINSIALEHER